MMEKLGQAKTHLELKKMIAEVDTNNSGGASQPDTTTHAHTHTFNHTHTHTHTIILTHTLTRAFSRKDCELVLCVFGYRYNPLQRVPRHDAGEEIHCPKTVSTQTHLRCNPFQCPQDVPCPEVSL